MKSYSTKSPTPVRRDLTDPRSSRSPGTAPRKTLLNDSRSTR